MSLGETTAQVLSPRAEAFSVDALLGRKTICPSRKLKTKKSGHCRLISDDVQHYGSSKNIILRNYGKQPFAKQRQRTTEKMHAKLQFEELWNKFHQLQNEMIITKSGRKMFPSLKVQLSGLDPDCQYIVWLDIAAVDNMRYRYMYYGSQWMAAGAGENPSPFSIYIHPDSPSTGTHWLSQPVSFDKLKLTNNRTPLTKGQVSLHSMHKYQPRIHVQKIHFTKEKHIKLEEIVKSEESTSFTFEETQFITVTAYQNQEITRLKIASNPFAKGFREISRHGRKLHQARFNKQRILSPFTDIMQQCISTPHIIDTNLVCIQSPCLSNSVPPGFYTSQDFPSLEQRKSYNDFQRCKYSDYGIHSIQRPFGSFCPSYFVPQMPKTSVHESRNTVIIDHSNNKNLEHSRKVTSKFPSTVNFNYCNICCT